MKPSSRIEAIIEIIAEVLKKEQIPADTLLTTYFRGRRYIGARDRKAVSELFYQILRHKILLTAIWQALGKEIPTARDLVLAGLTYLNHYTVQNISELFSGEMYSPSPLSSQEQKFMLKIASFSINHLSEAEQNNIQNWQLQELKSLYGKDLQKLLETLDGPASFDLRVNTLKATPGEVKKYLAAEGILAVPGRYSPAALRLPDRRPLAQHPLWKEGSIEVQDEGSQLIACLVDAKPGQIIWDYCAGAGGKTLAIAALMNNQGRIVATDIVEWRLRRSRERFKRAGVHNVDCHILDETANKWFKRQYERFDRVLIDVPCSGSGTWRRNPDLKWRLQEIAYHELLVTQASILLKASNLVKPGGRLIYATCSLFHSENGAQIENFLKENDDFSLLPIPLIWSQVLPGPCPTLEPTLQSRPDFHQVDGFFVAVLQRHLKKLKEV